MEEELLNPQVHVRSVARAVAILDQFTLDKPTLTLTEISTGLGLSKSTTHRLLSTLQRLELVELIPNSSRYRLGLKLFRLGSVVVKSMELISQADPILAELVSKTDETAFLVVPDGNEALCVRRIDGQQYVRVLFLEAGKRLGFNCGAAPRVLMAYMTPERRRQIYENYLRKMTTYTLVSPEELERDAEQIRRQGYAISKEDVTLHACALGVPVFDHTGQCVASISLSGIVQRFSSENLPSLIEATVLAGQDLSRRMGYIPD